jgi:hypothetical protein
MWLAGPSLVHLSPFLPTVYPPHYKNISLHNRYRILLIMLSQANSAVPYQQAKEVSSRGIITTIYPAVGFTDLESCSKFCLDGECYNGQGTPGCADFKPVVGSPNQGGTIRNLGCSVPGCICNPSKGFYQRTLQDTFDCFQASCLTPQTSSNACKVQDDQIDAIVNTIKNYCTANNIPVDSTVNHLGAIHPEPPRPTCIQGPAGELLIAAPDHNF